MNSDIENNHLFYYKKNINGFYTYHMFPKVNERIIENQVIVGQYTKRDTYIQEIIKQKRNMKRMDIEVFVPSTDIGMQRG